MTAVAQERLSQAEFERLAAPLRGELLAYCYRMLGSVHDAEDQVQETLLRAWRAAGTFEGRSSLRTWLYRIATNACLRALENRDRRPLPADLSAPAGPAGLAHGGGPGGPGAARREIAWLEPFPDALLPSGEAADPAAVVAARADLRLALVAALQYLPPRQRAVLILRDVLGWRAAEAAGLLGISAVAVNSLLQRARAQLGDAAPDRDAIREPDSAADRDLVGRYAAAFAAADVEGLTRLLAADAVFEMPPQPGWLSGRGPVAAFLADVVLTEPGRFRLLPARANGQPALGTYMRGQDGGYDAHAIQVLGVADAAVTRITAFRQAGLFAGFGLPPRLRAGASHVGAR